VGGSVLGDDCLDVLLDRADLLGEVASWDDLLLHVLHDWLGDVVLHGNGAVLRGGGHGLGGRVGVLLAHVQVGGRRPEAHLHLHGARRDDDVGDVLALDVPSHLVHDHLVVREDGGVHRADGMTARRMTGGVTVAVDQTQHGEGEHSGEELTVLKIRFLIDVFYGFPFSIYF